MKISSPHTGWAEQHPDTWWDHVVLSTKKLLRDNRTSDYDIAGIGISYQMHGLVVVDKNKNVIYPSIIWCDSRAVEIGDKAFADLGTKFCLSRYLNSPGNFTASKIKWLKESRPDIYENVYKIMLPGDYIALKLTGVINTTISGLSEGIFWDFKNNVIAEDLMRKLRTG